MRQVDRDPVVGQPLRGLGVGAAEDRRIVRNRHQNVLPQLLEDRDFFRCQADITGDLLDLAVRLDEFREPHLGQQTVVSDVPVNHPVQQGEVDQGIAYGLLVDRVEDLFVGRRAGRLLGVVPPEGVGFRAKGRKELFLLDGPARHR